MASRDRDGRQRGEIERRGNSLRVKAYAGVDPVTGKRVYRRATVAGIDEKAYKQAERKLTALMAEIDRQRGTPSVTTLGHVLDEWLRTVEIEDSTREGYEGYIRRTIRPVLGSVPISKITPRALENLYADLRRCRVRCDRLPHIEHKAADEHDCEKAQCRAHECRPMSASAVRQVHAVISGALNLAVRWEWLDTNPAKFAVRPKQKPPQPDPPSAVDAARLLDAAFELDYDWGTLVWLVMTTGVRRGEICALRWSRVDLDGAVVDFRRSYRLRRGIGTEKDTKTHQMRRIALDAETVELLREHKDRCRERLLSIGIELTEDMYIFHGVRDIDPNTPYSPHAVSSRYKDMADRLGIDTHIHALRHYSATELLTAGVDLRTVAGRLGHGGGGATTLRVYAAWVASSDRKAAEILASRMPKRARVTAAQGSSKRRPGDL